MAEMRRSPRIPITALVEASLPDGRTITTYVANLSREGIGIYFNEPLAEGTEVSIKLSYCDKSGQKKSKNIGGRVKWAYNGFCAAGLALQGLNEKEHGDLLEYIKSVGKQ